VAGVNAADWPYLFCRADSLSETVWVNRIGAFGVASAPCALAACVGTFVGHVTQAAVFWLLVYVDDLHEAFTGMSKFEIWLLAFELASLRSL